MPSFLPAIRLNGSIILVLLLSFQLANGQDGMQYAAQLLRVKQSFTALMESSRKAEDKLFDTIFAISRQFNNLSAEIVQSHSVAAQYTSILNNYERLTAYANKFYYKTDSVRQVLRFLNADISLKKQGSLALIITLASQVPVTVKVKQGSKDLSGYGVFVKPYFTLDNSAIIAFNPTDDAHRPLTPGWYSFWITLNGKTIQSRDETVNFPVDTVIFRP